MPKLGAVQLLNFKKVTSCNGVYYKHLTLPTIILVYISVVAV